MLGWRAVPHPAGVQLASIEWGWYFMRLHKASRNRLYQSTVQVERRSLHSPVSLSPYGPPPQPHQPLAPLSPKKDLIATSLQLHIHTYIPSYLHSTTKSSYSYNSHYYYYYFYAVRYVCMISWEVVLLNLLSQKRLKDFMDIFATSPSSSSCWRDWEEGGSCQ